MNCKFIQIINALLITCILLICVNPALSEVEFQVGDKIHLIGTYTASSDGSGKQYSGLYGEYIIARIQPNSRNPYALKPIDKDWIDGWANKDSILHDYTDVIMRDFIRELQKDSYFMYFGNDSQQIYALCSYFDLFNQYAKYDIKNKEQWNAFFSIEFPGSGVNFWFNGYVMNPADLGNYLYGLAGCYWGFSGKVIHQGAGYANMHSTAYMNRPDLLYGDLPEDFYIIERAIIDSNSIPKYDLDLSFMSEYSVVWDHLINLLK